VARSEGGGDPSHAATESQRWACFAGPRCSGSSWLLSRCSTVLPSLLPVDKLEHCQMMLAVPGG